ncbi:MAG: glycosyltransferase family 1 protein [Patescibacteria group bacterium]
MKIGINLIQYTDIQGIEVFTKNLLSSLIHQNSDNEYIFFVNQKSNNIFNIKSNNVKIIIKNFKKLSKLNLIFYQQFGLIKDLKKNKIDILYCPSTAAPIFYKNKIITIYDCISLRFKNETNFFSNAYLKLIFLSAKYFSIKIITISNFTKQEIVNLLKIPPQKIVNISVGIPSLPNIDNKILKTTLDKFNLSNKKYFFYIGNLRPHKNIKLLLKAWNNFFLEYQDYFLIIAGKKNNQLIKNILKYLNPKNHILFLGIISEEEKVILYQNSIALIFPSLYEGFGLPILEAQSLDVPVITSNISSLPEAAGLGAIFVDPYDYKSISSGLKKIIDSPFLKNKLIQDGRKNLERFSWNKSSLLLLNSFKQ